jgi:hypothetical protein
MWINVDAVIWKRGNIDMNPYLTKINHSSITHSLIDRPRRTTEGRLECWVVVRRVPGIQNINQSLGLISGLGLGCRMIKKSWKQMYTIFSKFKYQSVFSSPSPSMGLGRLVILF